MAYETSIDDMNVFQMPIRVNGASVTNDLAVRVVDTTPVKASLGVKAVNGDWTFGLAYKFGVGGDERMDNSFNARAVLVLIRRGRPLSPEGAVRKTI